MQASHGCHVPSASLLRFLRNQLATPAAAPPRKASLSRQCRAYTTTTERLASCLAIRNTSLRPNCHNSLRYTRPASRAASTSSKPLSSSSPPHRTLSTTSSLREAFWRRLRTSPRPKSPDRSRDSDYLPYQALPDDSTSLGGRSVRPNTDLKLRCTELDEQGNVVLVDGEYRKHELVQKYSLQPRDVRKIDSLVVPNIQVRPSAILINLLHIRCLVKHNRVCLFDVAGTTDSYIQGQFMYELEGKLRQKQTSLTAGGPLPYEFRALEAVLMSVTSALEHEFEGVRGPVIRLLGELEDDIDRDKLRQLLQLSKKLGTFEQRARLVRDAIDNVLEADDDLTSMYLTEKAQGREREEDDHEEIEFLLESYHKFAEEVVQVSGNLISAIKNTEDIVRAILDANRNSLMLLDLKFSILTLGTTVGMFIAALYGMNLENFIEETNYGFFGISGLCTVLTIVSVMWGMRRLRTVQRMRMWGEGGSRARDRARGRQGNNRGSWRELDGPESARLGDTVKGIRSREAVRNWQVEQKQRLDQMKRAGRAVEALPPAKL